MNAMHINSGARGAPPPTMINMSKCYAKTSVAASNTVNMCAYVMDHLSHSFLIYFGPMCVFLCAHA